MFEAHHYSFLQPRTGTGVPGAALGFECFIAARLLVDAVTVVHVSAHSLPVARGLRHGRPCAGMQGQAQSGERGRTQLGWSCVRISPGPEAPWILSFCLPSSPRSVCVRHPGGEGAEEALQLHTPLVSPERDARGFLEAAGEQVWLPRGVWRKAFHWRDPEGAHLA